MMVVDVLLGAVVLVNAWLLSARTRPVEDRGDVLKRMR